MKKKRETMTVAALMDQLADESTAISVARLYALSNLEKSDWAHFEAAWPRLPDDRRHAVMRHLVDIAESNFEVSFGPAFRLGLTDPDAAVREAAIDGLWEDEDLKLIKPLLAMLQRDSSPSVRATAASALGHYVYLDAIDEISHAQAEPLIQALRAVIDAQGEPLEVRRRAVEAISYSSADDVPDIIRQAYAAPEEEMRISAVFAMGSSADDQWIETVVAELDSPSPAMRYEAAHAAGELEARSAVPALARMLDDPDREAQQMAVWALGQVGGDRAQTLLTGLTDSDDAALAEAAMDALEEMEWMHGGNRDMPLFAFDPYADEDDE
jgi:HEAT repeat protein